MDESRYPDGKEGAINGLIFRLGNARSPEEFRIALEEMYQGIPSQGRKKGIEEGEGTLFLKMAELKYGPLPDWVKEKVAGANIEMVERWAGKLLNARTLSEVFE